MKRASLLLLASAPFALFASSPAFAEANPAAATDPVTTTAAPAAKGPALWKVADSDTTIYLFGTVHVLPKDVDWYDATIAKAFEGSDILVTEIPMDAAAEADMQKLTMAKGMLPSGTTVRSLLTAEQTTQYTAALAKLGAPPEAFDPLKPWLVGLTFSIVPLMQSGYDPNSGVEKVLLAKTGDKPKGALETDEFQLGIFDTMPQDAQVAFMMEAATDMDKAKPMLDRMVAEWIEGDADQLAEVMNEGMDDPKVAEALLYNRNANWANWIKTRLDQPGTVFIAVGAGHLAGAKSVQDLLTQKGIKVTRVK